MTRGPWKLNAGQVFEIRRRYKGKCRKNGAKALAREFGLHEKYIDDLVRGKSWKSVL